MSAYRSSPAFDRQYPDCPGCGHDLTDLKKAIFCPGCGRQLQYRITCRDRLAESASHLLSSLTFGRFGHHPLPPATEMNTDRTPILIGYGKAMFNLGWRYERGQGSFRNLPEALRCYRKSARLGNVDATVRLTGEPPRESPAQVDPPELKDLADAVEAEQVDFDECWDKNSRM